MSGTLTIGGSETPMNNPTYRSSPESSVALPESLRKGLLERTENDALELPMLPDTAAQVIEMCRDENVDAQDLADWIHRDQALASHVLRVANSALYAPGEPIVSLQQAVSRLGLGLIGEISVGVALKGKIFQVPGFESRLTELWRHSACAGAYAKEIARSARLNVEGAFLCGLLHDVGKPVVLSALLEVAKDLNEEVDSELAELAMNEFHTVIGPLLLTNWKLPAWMSDAAEFHHNTDCDSAHRSVVLVTALADSLAHWALETGEMDEETLGSLPILAELNFYPDDLEALKDRRDEMLEVAKAF